MCKTATKVELVTVVLVASVYRSSGRGDVPFTERVISTTANGASSVFATDVDGDGTIDACDGCLLDPDKTVPGICGCGIDDNSDADGDAGPDCTDQCPGVDDALYAPECIGAIPTTSMWGLAILTLLLLAAGKIYFGRRQAVWGHTGLGGRSR
jgi:hypothetical protein